MLAYLNSGEDVNDVRVGMDLPSKLQRCQRSPYALHLN